MPNTPIDRMTYGSTTYEFRDTTKVASSQGSGNAGKTLKVNSSGTLELADFPAELPAVTTSDNGKVLRVVSGAWAAAQLPSASGVSF